MAIFVNLPILADPDKPIFNQTLKLEMTVKQSGESFLPTSFYFFTMVLGSVSEI